MIPFFEQHILFLLHENNNCVDLPTPSDVCFFFFSDHKRLELSLMFKLRNEASPVL